MNVHTMFKSTKEALNISTLFTLLQKVDHERISIMNFIIFYESAGRIESSRFRESAMSVFKGTACQFIKDIYCIVKGNNLK